MSRSLVPYPLSARRHNTSFNVLVRRLIEQTVLPSQPRWLDDTFRLMDKADVESGDPVAAIPSRPP